MLNFLKEPSMFNSNNLNVTHQGVALISLPPPATATPSDLLDMPECIRLSWAAGFIDGDGCISGIIQRYKDRKTPSVRLVVSVVQNDIHTLQVLQKILDEKSHLFTLKRQRCHNRQAYELLYAGRHAISVLQKIEPYLIRKKMECWAAQELHREGCLSVRPGPNGHPEAVHRARAYWVNKLRNLK
jgi:hypothetical protein